MTQGREEQFHDMGVALHNPKRHASVPLCFAILVHQVISRTLLLEFVIRFLASSIFASFSREYGVSPATWAHAPS